MRAYYSAHNNHLFKKYLPEVSFKVAAELTHHLYTQANIALFASLFCATIVFIGLFPLKNSLIWFSIYLCIFIARILLVGVYKKLKPSEKNNRMWRNLYILGTTLGGISWGLGSILLLPYGNITQQGLLILMLAGVTGGAIPISSAIPGASISFLVFSIAPFIISIIFLGNNIYLLFDMALTIYLFYSILVAIKGYQLIKDSIELKFANDALLRDLSAAKEELEVINKKLEQAATHDALTQLANRSLFHIHLENAIKKSKKHQVKFALLYIDLDRFKLVNDLYGHDVGDKLLIAITSELKNFFNEHVSIARLGGDELTIILENIKTQEEVKKIADKLCRIIAAPIIINNTVLKIGASIGISIYPDDGDDVESLLKHADKSMYYVKEHGGNYFSVGEKELIEY